MISRKPPLPLATGPAFPGGLIHRSFLCNLFFMLPQVPALLWLLAGFLFVLVEIATPSFVFIFFGTSAVVTGVALWLGMPNSYGAPFILFSLLTLGQVFFLRTAFKNWFRGGVISSAGPESDEFIGREVVVVSGFENGNGRGRVEFRGTQWAAVSTDTFSAGEIASVCGRDGHTLAIEKQIAS